MLYAIAMGPLNVDFAERRGEDASVYGQGTPPSHTIKENLHLYHSPLYILVTLDNKQSEFVFKHTPPFSPNRATFPCPPSSRRQLSRMVPRGAARFSL